MSTTTEGNTRDATACLRAALNGIHSMEVKALLEEAIGAPGPHHPISAADHGDALTHIVLTTNDGATFLPERGFIAERSGLLCGMLNAETVPLPNVAARELKRMLWLLQQGFEPTQLERCIAAFEIESVVALQQAANFMDVRCITVASAGVIARLVREVVGGEERAQLLDLVTPPQLPQELCELWLGKFSEEADELLELLAKHPDQLLTPLAHWDAAWTDEGSFSEHRFNLGNDPELSLLKVRLDVVAHKEGASPMEVTIDEGTTDSELLNMIQLPQISVLNLEGCGKVTDHGLAHIKVLPQLTSLDLGFCNQITDEGLMHIKEMTQLMSLNLANCESISDSGLKHLLALSQLTSLELDCCDNITDEGVHMIQRALPGCNVTHSAE